jgi:hypothetical protein
MLFFCLALLFGAVASPLPVRAGEELPPPVKALMNAFGLDLNMRPTVGAVREIENGYELEDVTFLDMKVDGEHVVSIHTARVHVTGYQERDGLLRFAQVQLRDTRLELPLEKQPAKRMRVDIPVLDIVEASVLPEAAARDDMEKLASARLFASAISMPEATIELPEMKLQWRGLKNTWKGDRRKGTGVSDTDFGVLTIPAKRAALLNKREGPRNAEILERLGLTTLSFTGHSHQEIVVKPDNRVHATSAVRLGFLETGFLTIEMQDLAFPVAMLGQVRQLAEKLRGNRADGLRGQNPKPGASAAPPYNPLADARLMNVISQLTLRGLVIGWEDRGITRKALEMQAEREGKSVDDLVRQTMQQAQVSLSAILPPPLLEKTLNALMTYLHEPKSIQLSLKGANGQYVTVPALLSAFMSPQALFGLLEVDISANE